MWPLVWIDQKNTQPYWSSHVWRSNHWPREFYTPSLLILWIHRAAKAERPLPKPIQPIWSEKKGRKNRSVQLRETNSAVQPVSIVAVYCSRCSKSPSTDHDNLMCHYQFFFLYISIEKIVNCYHIEQMSSVGNQYGFNLLIIYCYLCCRSYILWEKNLFNRLFAVFVNHQMGLSRLRHVTILTKLNYG